MGDRETFTTYKAGDVELVHGDLVGIDGNIGAFKFIRHVVTDKSEWIDLYGPVDEKNREHGQFRAVVPARLKIIKAKRAAAVEEFQDRVVERKTRRRKKAS